VRDLNDAGCGGWHGAGQCSLIAIARRKTVELLALVGGQDAGRRQTIYGGGRGLAGVGLPLGQMQG